MHPYEQAFKPAKTQENRTEYAWTQERREDAMVWTVMIPMAALVCIVVALLPW